MITSLFRVILVAVAMEITVILKLVLLLVSQKAPPDLTVHMELPVSLLQMTNAGSALLLLLPGADLLRPLKQKPPDKGQTQICGKELFVQTK